MRQRATVICAQQQVRGLRIRDSGQPGRAPHSAAPTGSEATRADRSRRPSAIVAEVPAGIVLLGASFYGLLSAPDMLGGEVAPAVGVDVTFYEPGD